MRCGGCSVTRACIPPCAAAAWSGRISSGRTGGQGLSSDSGWIEGIWRRPRLSLFSCDWKGAGKGRHLAGEMDPARGEATNCGQTKGPRRLDARLPHAFDLRHHSSGHCGVRDGELRGRCPIRTGTIPLRNCSNLDAMDLWAMFRSGSPRRVEPGAGRKRITRQHVGSISRSKFRRAVPWETLRAGR